MSKEKAIKYITRAKEQLSDDLLSVRFCQMARNNLDKALKELEDWYKHAINDTFNDGKDAVNNLSDKELLSEFKEIE